MIEKSSSTFENDIFEYNFKINQVSSICCEYFYLNNYILQHCFLSVNQLVAGSYVANDGEIIAATVGVYRGFVLVHMAFPVGTLRSEPEPVLIADN